MTRLTIDSVSKSYHEQDGSKKTVFKDVSFETQEGVFTSLIGPSGCGKTTMLNIIAGLTAPDEGVLKVDGLPVNSGELFCSYVFQEPRLLDWATVRENISLVLQAQGVDDSKIEPRIDTYLRKVGLADEIDTYPRSLSGGMQQRVGIARALAVESDIILMDEPFSSLDEITARQLREDLMEIWKQTSKTIIFVTHDIREAIYLSDKILMFSPGKGITHREKIQMPRPRDMKDPGLLERESELMEQMAGDFEENA